MGSSVFSSFKIKNLIDAKDSVSKTLPSNVVYKFTCTGCNSVYVGETSRHLSTRVREHLHTDKNSNIFKHLGVLINVGNLAVTIVSRL